MLNRTSYRQLTRSSFLALGTAIFSNALGFLAPTDVLNSSLGNQLSPNQASAQELDEDIWTSMYQQVSPAVVIIKTEYLYRDNESDTWKRGQVTGSGIIISSNGYIITNAHVVALAARHDLPVKICTSRSPDDCFATEIRAIGDTYSDLPISSRGKDGIPPYELRNDLAVLRIQDFESLPFTFPFIPISYIENLLVGQPVAAIGSPEGSIPNAMSLGIISQIIPDRIQHDAAINPGNSGGPLFNSQGSVIGINTIRSESQKETLEVQAPGASTEESPPPTEEITVQIGEDIQNVGFAIPTSVVIEFLARNGIAVQSTPRTISYIEYQPGTLGEENDMATEEGFYDEHTFEVQLGQRVSVNLVSRAFLPELSLRNSSGTFVATSRDSVPNRLNAEILTPPLSAGTYTVRVTSQQPIGRGDYLLTVVDAQTLSNR